MQLSSSRAISTLEALASLAILCVLLAAFWSSLYADQAVSRRLAEQQSISSEIKAATSRLREIAADRTEAFSYSAKYFELHCQGADAASPHLRKCSAMYSSEVPSSLESVSEIEVWVP